MSARADANPLVAWRGCEVRRYRDDLFAMAPLPPVPGPDPIRWIGRILFLPDGLGCLALRTGDGQDLAPALLFPQGLTVRFGVRGVSCRRGLAGHRRPLRKLYQDDGVPPWVRPYIPLVFADDVLVAVGDLWACHSKGEEGGPAFRVDWRSGLPERLNLRIKTGVCTVSRETAP